MDLQGICTPGEYQVMCADVSIDGGKRVKRVVACVVIQGICPPDVYQLDTIK